MMIYYEGCDHRDFLVLLYITLERIINTAVMIHECFFSPPVSSI